MSPSSFLDRSRADRPVAISSVPFEDERAFARYSWLVAGVAVAVGVVLVASGESWPPLGLLSLFAGLAWLAVNRYTFFPRGIAVTAESAVILASIAVFRRDAPLLGPWCAAALVGPLDALHWEQRAFSRMAFNAAHQMVAVVGAALVFDAVVPPTGASAAQFAWAAMVACVTFLVLELLACVGALRVWTRTPPVAGLRDLLVFDWVILPLGVIGALVGVLATVIGWWVLPTALVPIVFLPPLLLAVPRWVVGSGAVEPWRRGALVAASVVFVVGAPFAVVVAGDGCAAVTCLLALTIAATAELRRGTAFVPPLAGVLLALIVASAGPELAWSSPLRSVAALGAGLLLAIVAALSSSTPDRRHELASVGWSVPLIAIAVTLGVAVRRFGLPAAAFAAVAVPLGAALLVAWAAPTWRSAILGRRLARLRPTRHGAALVAIVAVATAMAAGALVVSEERVVAVLMLAAVVAIELTLALAAAVTRQWRFVPHSRVTSGVLVAATSVVVVAIAPAFATSATAGALIVVSVGGVIAVAVVPRRSKRSR